jgi:hypothetical protein
VQQGSISAASARESAIAQTHKLLGELLKDMRKSESPNYDSDSNAAEGLGDQSRKDGNYNQNKDGNYNQNIHGTNAVTTNDYAGTTNAVTILNQNINNQNNHTPRFSAEQLHDVIANLPVNQGGALQRNGLAQLGFSGQVPRHYSLSERPEDNPFVTSGRVNSDANPSVANDEEASQNAHDLSSQNHRNADDFSSQRAGDQYPPAPGLNEFNKNDLTIDAKVQAEMKEKPNHNDANQVEINYQSQNQNIATSPAAPSPTATFPPHLPRSHVQHGSLLHGNQVSGINTNETIKYRSAGGCILNSIENWK